MASCIFFLVVTLAVANAVPIWIEGPGLAPIALFRMGRSPDVAFGFGSGFSSNIGGIGHATSIGTSFSSGQAQASGSAITDNNGFAHGAATARAAPNTYGFRIPSELSRNFGSAISSAHSYGGLSSAIAQSYGIPLYGRYHLRNYDEQDGGINSVIATAEGGYGTAVSSAQVNDGDYLNAAISAAENIGGVAGSTAHTLQNFGGVVRSTGASSIKGPGIQAAQSHVVNTDDYY